MLKPKVKASEFTKYGFKRCKGYPKELEWYYLCIAADSKVLFVSDVCFFISDWYKNDSRIHKLPNCKYRDNRDSWDVIYDLIIDGVLVKSKKG